MVSTGNTQRDSMIREAIAIQRQADPIGEHPLDVANVGQHLPADFDLDAGEVSTFGSEKPEDIVEAEFTVVEPGDSAAPTPAIEMAVEPPTQTEIEEAADAVVRLTDELSQAKANVNLAQRRHGEAVTKRNRAVSQFIAGRQPYTPDQLARDSARAAMEERAAIKNGSMAPPERPIPGNSTVDRAAAYSKGDIEGCGNFRRVVSGGQQIYPASKRGAYVKVPSVR
jgi:HAMP domain-containing protein